MARSVFVRLFSLALAATFCAMVQSAQFEVGVHNMQAHAPKASAHAKRLMRTDTKAEGAALAEESDAIPVGSVLDRTIHAFHEQKSSGEYVPASLLATKGPGKLDDTTDPFGASVGAMQKMSKDISIDCSLNYGQQMLENLMLPKSEHHLCTGPSSTVTCHEREPFDVPRFMCELNNVMISADGTSVSDCQKSGDFDDFINTQGITENNIFGKSTKFGTMKAVQGKLDCASNATSSKAIVQVPTNTVNFYEWYGDWVTLWETLAAMKWDPKDVHLYLVGDISGEKGKAKKYRAPFDEAWARAFPAGAVHVGSYADLFGKGVCFSSIVTAPQGALSTMTFRGGRGGVVGCPSPTLMASALWLQALFPAPSLPTVPTETPGKTVTLLLRHGLRGFENDLDAIDTVKSVMPKDWSLRIYSPENVTDLAEQLNVAATSQVWVGVHGAGMMHVLFLPPKARVVEIFCEDRPRGNRHFQNLEGLAETNAHPHLFQYYYDSDIQRCKVDKENVQKAIKAYEDSIADAPAQVTPA